MKTKVAIASGILSLFLLASPILAHDVSSPFSTPRTKHILSNGSLKSCQARETAVKTRMISLVRLAMNTETKFDLIAKRVEDFYTNKVLPTGKTVSNYDTLVKNISDKKDIV